MIEKIRKWLCKKNISHTFVASEPDEIGCIGFRCKYCDRGINGWQNRHLK